MTDEDRASARRRKQREYWKVYYKRLTLAQRQRRYEAVIRFKTSHPERWNEIQSRYKKRAHILIQEVLEELSKPEEQLP